MPTCPIRDSLAHHGRYGRLRCVLRAAQRTYLVYETVLPGAGPKAADEASTSR